MAGRTEDGIFVCYCGNKRFHIDHEHGDEIKCPKCGRLYRQPKGWIAPLVKHPDSDKFVLDSRGMN